jgi:hypothetical protein
MSYVSVERFQRYCGVQAKPELLKTYIDAAQNILASYLGYEPSYTHYTTIVQGTGTSQVSLQAKPIQTILELLIDGEVLPSSQCITRNEFLYRKKVPFPEGSTIIVTYGAGYAEVEEDSGDGDDGIIDGGDAATVYDDNPQASGALILTPMPYIIKLTVLRIAALLQAESDSNIGITSKSFGESGSRTFINYTNFDKYLLPIANYKLLVV